jgi:hypothetical protein
MEVKDKQAPVLDKLRRPQSIRTSARYWKTFQKKVMITLLLITGPWKEVTIILLRYMALKLCKIKTIILPFVTWHRKMTS